MRILFVQRNQKLLYSTILLLCVTLRHHFGEYHDAYARRDTLQNGAWWCKVIVFVVFVHKKYSRSFIKLQLNHVTWTILTMSLLCFCAFIVVVPLLSMEGQRALGFHQNILICVLMMNKGLTGLERHEGEYYRIFIFGWTIPLKKNMFNCQTLRISWYFCKTWAIDCYLSFMPYIDITDIEKSSVTSI